MKHPKFITFLRELQGDRVGYWEANARKTAKMDGHLGLAQSERARKMREDSLPSYAVVYLEVALLAAVVAGLIWLLVSR